MILADSNYVLFLKQCFRSEKEAKMQITIHVSVDSLQEAFRAVLLEATGFQPAFGVDYEGDEWKLYVEYYCEYDPGNKGDLERLVQAGLVVQNNKCLELPAQLLLRKVFHAEGKDVLINAYASEHDRKMVRIVMPYEHYKNVVLDLIA